MAELYEWISSGGCERCDNAEGLYREEPERPHPHCNCEIAPVEEDRLAELLDGDDLLDLFGADELVQEFGDQILFGFPDLFEDVFEGGQTDEGEWEHEVVDDVADARKDSEASWIKIKVTIECAHGIKAGESVEEEFWELVPKGEDPEDFTEDKAREIAEKLLKGSCKEAPPEDEGDSPIPVPVEEWPDWPGPV